MFIKQLSVFIENKKGALAEFARILGENNIDILAVTIADTTEFGILRAIVSDSEKAKESLEQAFYAVNITDVVAVTIADVPGGLVEVLDTLAKKDVDVEYLYSFVRHIGEMAVVILRVNKPKEAVELLNENGIRIVTQEEIATM